MHDLLVKITQTKYLLWIHVEFLPSYWQMLRVWIIPEINSTVNVRQWQHLVTDINNRWQMAKQCIPASQINCFARYILLPHSSWPFPAHVSYSFMTLHFVANNLFSYWDTQLCILTIIISFHKCFYCLSLQPVDRVLVSFVNANPQQAAVNFYNRTYSDDIFHLTALTEFWYDPCNLA